jgi:branched-chain amino acid transport system ATP-binding protein
LADVCVTFGGVKAVSGVSLEIRAGSVVGLIGPNGSGKTTLLNAIVGIVAIDRGRILLRGRDVTRAPSYKRAALGLARTYQQIRLFEAMSVMENVLVALDCKSDPRLRTWILTRGFEKLNRKTKEARAREVLTMLEIDDYREVLATTLPYGLQRRVEIARTIAPWPNIVLLDEPTAGMSRLEAESVGRLVRRLREEGLSILIVEHNFDLMMDISDYMHVLNFGTCIAAGPPEVVRQNPEVITAYLGDVP